MTINLIDIMIISLIILLTLRIGRIITWLLLHLVSFNFWRNIFTSEVQQRLFGRELEAILYIVILVALTMALSGIIMRLATKFAEWISYGALVILAAYLIFSKGQSLTDTLLFGQIFEWVSGLFGGLADAMAEGGRGGGR